MKYPLLKYAPSVTALLDSFDGICNSAFDSETQPDNYVQTLLALGMVIVENNKYKPSDEWSFLIEETGSNRIHALCDKLSQRAEVRDIECFVSKSSDCNYENLKSQFSEMDDSTLQNWLLWLTELELLSNVDNNYVLYEDDTEDDEADEEEPYGNEVINIKEDKYSVFEYYRRINKGFIQMSPNFQRNLVWSKVQQSRFIESALLGLPLPPIYLKKESDTKFIVVDGLQRSATLKLFMDDQLALVGLNKLQKLNGIIFSKLDTIQDGLSARLEDCQLNMFVMQPSVPMSLIYDVFNRINTGGTQLSRQEIRNCIFQGKATKILKEIVATSIFKNAIGYGIKPKRMKDCEALLRCIAFVIMDISNDYEGSMDDFLEKAMRKLNKMDSSELEILKDKIMSVLERTYRIFGDSNFRIHTEYTRGRINVAVMETVFYFFFRQDRNDTIADRVYQERYNRLLEDEKYLGAVKSSTGSKNQVKLRFNKVIEYLGQ